MNKSAIYLLIVFLLGIFCYAQEQPLNNETFVGINTRSPQTTLDVNGKVTIRETNNLENEGHIKPLYIDKESGLVGTIAPAIPTAAISVLTAHNDNIMPSDETSAGLFNQGNTDLTVPLSTADLSPNNLGITVDNNSIVILEDGTYQINAYLNIIMSTPSTNKKITVEFPEVYTTTGKPKVSTQTIEIPAYHRLVFLYAKLKKGNSVIAGTRPILTNILSNQSNIVSLPTVTLKLQQGDKLSLAFSRTMSSSNGVSSPAGDDVTKIGLGANYGASPYSLTITKL